MGIRIGILALQGDVSEHQAAFSAALSECGEAGEVFLLRRAEEIEGCDALAIPGGESTTISRLIEKNGMTDPLRAFEGGIFATCAGMVLIASEVDDPRVAPLSLMDISVSRNAFGRQKESCEREVTVEGLDSPFCGYFIRAPVICRTGPAARVLAQTGDEVVGAVQGLHMALSFHPELGGDLRLHRLFLQNLGLF